MLSLHIDTRPDWRGGQQQILLLTDELRRRGHDAQLLALTGSPLARRAAADGFTVYSISRSIARFAAALEIRHILKRMHCDIVHAHDPHSLTAAWLAGAHRSSTLVVARRVAYPLTSSRIGLARYRAARLILAVSRYVANSVASSGINPAQIKVVPDGVTLPAITEPAARGATRARFGIAPEDLCLGCVGYLLPEKSQETIIRAMPSVLAVQANAKLLLAGDGPMRTEVESLSRQLGVRHAILFTGFLEDVEPVYRALDVFLFPSLAEPLGSSLLAAMSYAIPCIAADSGGVPEILETDRNGILVPPGESAMFADAILALAANPIRAAALGASARETISMRFSVDALGTNTIAAYARAMIR
jgi:glycosyltransferase involved in cell wall biosynthesis